ncbi:MAG: hypothetical protein V7603_2818 [Micromonosporaceae bacterium]
MPEEFVPIAERVIEALLETDPALAGYAGDHRFDDRLPDLSTGAVAGEVAMLREASAALSQVDYELLDPAELVDHAVLTSLVERSLFERTEVREHEWNPLVHNPGDLLDRLISRPFAPAEQRLASLAGRLAAVPDLLAGARATLTGCPHIHLETAIGQFTGTAGLIEHELPALVAEAPALAGTVNPAARRAVAALREFVGWLRASLSTSDSPFTSQEARDPRLGRPLWEARLWHTLDTELSAAEVLARARARFDRIGAELREAAAELVGGAATDDTVRLALDRLAGEHPDDGSIVDLAKVTLDETTEFVREHDLVSLVDDPCVIKEMPEHSRGVAVAYCDPPGPLEPAAVPTFYCIAPTPADWPAQWVTSFYREYNNHMVRELTVHEAMPGHFLQLAHARRYQGPTRARAVTMSGPFVEGWAVCAEELMVRHGFGGLPLRLQQLKMQLRMSLNAILDQLVHCEDLPEAEAMALMTGRGFQEEGEAAGKWRRAQLTSTQLSTYFVGYTEVSALVAARPEGVSPRAWHDRLIGFGSIPPRHVSSLLGG